MLTPRRVAKLLKQEDKVIQSHQELVEVINLGTEEEKKEVKVGASVNKNIKKKFV